MRYYYRVKITYSNTYEYCISIQVPQASRRSMVLSTGKCGGHLGTETGQHGKKADDTPLNLLDSRGAWSSHLYILRHV